ncbi:hypothetical protein BDGGKGIB_03429 [Nodularia sphaerocarpa UHCC 0038]|nr:hypothetical protein BDGGKGIB_03429 [Nodularia sphaerocarpa UHCC 0038]
MQHFKRVTPVGSVRRTRSDNQDEDVQFCAVTHHLNYGQNNVSLVSRPVTGLVPLAS